MAFQVRRGLEQNLTSFTPSEGELLYTTDSKKLFVGNNQGTADLVSAPVLKVNGYPNTQYPNAQVTLTTSDIAEPLVASNLYFTQERAQDAVAAALTAGTHSGITFTYGSTQDGANRIDASVARQVVVGDSNIIGGVAFYDSASTVIYSTSLSYNDLTKTLVLTDGSLTVTSGNVGRTVYSSLNYSGSSSNANSSMYTRKARGSSTSPQPVQTQDTLGSFDFGGYASSDYVNAVKLEASVDNYAVTSTAVPGLFGLYTADNTGALQPRLRVDSLGRVFIGAYYANDPGGQMLIRGASNTSGTASILSVRNLDSTAGSGAVVSLSRLRGTYAAPTATQAGDSLAVIKASGWDGTSGTTVTPTTSESSRIEFVADTVSTGKVVGSMYVKVANTAGTLGNLARFYNSTATANGTLAVTGTVSASVGFKTATYATGSLPTLSSGDAGFIAFDSTTNQFKGWTGSAWVAFN